jgi:hypothetical protein
MCGDGKELETTNGSPSLVAILAQLTFLQVVAKVRTSTALPLSGEQMGSH